MPYIWSVHFINNLNFLIMNKNLFVTIALLIFSIVAMAGPIKDSGKNEPKAYTSKISATHDQICGHCKGTGRVICYHCKGAGRVKCAGCGGRGYNPYSSKRPPCTICNGKATTKCGICYGSGTLSCNRCYGKGRTR